MSPLNKDTCPVAPPHYMPACFRARLSLCDIFLTLKYLLSNHDKIILLLLQTMGCLYDNSFLSRQYTAGGRLTRPARSQGGLRYRKAEDAILGPARSAHSFCIGYQCSYHSQWLRPSCFHNWLWTKRESSCFETYLWMECINSSRKAGRKQYHVA